MGLISIEDMEFYAYHGCFEEEKQIGTKFLVNIELQAPTKEAEETDRLEKTVNYQEVYGLIKKEMQKPSNLLEHVARRILNTICNRYPNVSYGKIKISKMNPPLGGKMKNVSVSLSTKDQVVNDHNSQ
ncbi:MAG: dihydroneopterin aldolase [Bacteroidales bacterium]